jgi:hypothetical protein
VHVASCVLQIVCTGAPTSHRSHTVFICRWCAARRWQLGAGGGEPLPGGSRGVACALCPVACGAFKQATDGSQRWVHLTCGLWHNETKVAHGECMLLLGGPASGVAGTCASDCWIELLCFAAAVLWSDMADRKCFGLSVLTCFACMPVLPCSSGLLLVEEGS